MRFGNGFYPPHGWRIKKNLLLAAVVAAIFSFCIGQSALAKSGKFFGWGVSAEMN